MNPPTNYTLVPLLAVFPLPPFAAAFFFIWDAVLQNLPLHINGAPPVLLAYEGCVSGALDETVCEAFVLPYHLNAPTSFFFKASIALLKYTAFGAFAAFHIKSFNSWPLNCFLKLLYRWSIQNLCSATSPFCWSDTVNNFQIIYKSMNHSQLGFSASTTAQANG